MRLVPWCLVAAASFGCTRERNTLEPLPVSAETDAGASATSSGFTSPLPPFVAAMGAAPRVVPATAGSYAGGLRMMRSALPTMEISIDESSSGRVTLALHDDGTAEGCFASKWSRTRSESHFSSKSGKNESSTDKRRTLVGARGGWSRDVGGWVRVRFDAVTKDACVPPTPLPPEKSYGAFELRCVRFEASAALPTALVACTPGEAEWPVSDLLAPLATEKPKAWLVLADAAVGVTAAMDYGRTDGLGSGGTAEPPPKITFESGPVALNPAMWSKD